MDCSEKKRSRNANSRMESLISLAEVCQIAYESGVTLEEVQHVSGAAWADFLDPRERKTH